MYCGGVLGAAPADSEDTEKEAVTPERAQELLDGLTPQARSMMPADVLASLQDAAAAAKPKAPTKPPIVRSRLGFTGLGRRGTTSAAMPPVKGPDPDENTATLMPPPPPAADPSNETTLKPTPRAREDESLEGIPSDRLTPLPPPSADADLPEDPPTLERMRAVDDDSISPIATAAISPLDTSELEVLDESQLTSYYDLEPISSAPPPTSEGPITRALRRGGGPFGPRDLAHRLILLPSDGYRSKVHWLRHRLADTTGMDLYTAAQTLSKEVPSYLFGSNEQADVEERAEHLRQGGLSVLVLGHDHDGADIEPIYVTEAWGDRAGPVTFKTWNGALIEVKRTGFAWACLGEIPPDGDRKPLVRERGFRGREVPDRPTFDASAGPYILLDIFLTRAEQPIRIRADRFDFGCLGTLRELAATLNLRKMLKWLPPEDGPPLPMDEHFKRLPALRSSAATTPEGEVPIRHREIEFTEYGLIVNAQRRGARRA